jgi:hypothetical protein
MTVERRHSRQSLSGIHLGCLSDGYPPETAGMTEGGGGSPPQTAGMNEEEMVPRRRLAMYCANKPLHDKLFDLGVTVKNGRGRNKLLGEIILGLFE